MGKSFLLFSKNIGGYIKMSNLFEVLLNEKLGLYYFSDKVEIGKKQQHIYVKGKDLNNPILIFLHGGPGFPEWGALNKYNQALFEHYTVVHWDQRGTAKSYEANENLSLDILYSDLEDLVQIVLRSLKQSKCFIAGHSWGSVLGLMYASEHPETVHAYIGINQIIDRAKEEERSYNFLADSILHEVRKKPIQQFKRLNPPKDGQYDSIKQLSIQRKLLHQQKGFAFNNKLAKKVMSSILLTPEYSISEKFKIFKAFHHSMEQLWSDFAQINFLETIHKLNVPIYLIVGANDYVASYFHTHTFLNRLEAPFKELYFFEQSGHLACYEESERFNQIMIDTVLNHK
jgi:proline iminopeptidase